MNNTIHLITALRFATISLPIRQWINRRKALVNEDKNDALVVKAECFKPRYTCTGYLSIFTMC